MLAVDHGDSYVLAYLRKNPGSGHAILLVLNMSGEERTLKLDLAALGRKGDSAKPLLASPEAGQASMRLEHFVIAPFGVFVGGVD